MFAIRDDRTTVRESDFRAAKDKIDETDEIDHVGEFTDYQY